MLTYKVTVSTGSLSLASTLDRVYIKLVGSKGESGRTHLTNIRGPADFFRDTTSTFSVDCPLTLGELVLIELDKKGLVGDDWFPSKIEIKSPEGNIYLFPIYQWITDGKTQVFRSGKALLPFEDKLPLAKKCREEELEQRKQDYQWDIYMEGIPHCMKCDNPADMPLEVRFSFTKSTEFLYTADTSLLELKLKALMDSKDNWTNIEAIESVKNTAIADYVQSHWKDDAFFGYQYLNGVNPMLIRRCSALPGNFPVTNDMLSLHGGRSLEKEMKLKQTPSEDNPIFLPADSQHDWLMAKIYVRSAHFSEHELNVHLLRTHLLAETFALSLLRNVPMVHPLYKLLIPHTRYTLQINSLARKSLISEDGIFNTFAASGGEALKTILQRSTSSLTYSSLCLPDDIKERGMDSLPGFHYRDDGLRLWAIIHKFVEGILGYYYKTEADVQKDSELQMWIQDIFKQGFLSQASTGVPKSFSSVSVLVKFVTMVIFTCSAKHSAVNSGQYDYGGWMPNAPVTLRRPPPTTKGSSSGSSMLQTLPDIGTTVHQMATLWLLSKQSTDFVPLGHYPDRQFSEESPLKHIDQFQKELKRRGKKYDYGGWMPNAPVTLRRPPPTTKGSSSGSSMLQTLPDIGTTVHQMATLWLLSKQSTDFVPLGHYPDRQFSEESPLKHIDQFQKELKRRGKKVRRRNKDMKIPYTYMDPKLMENSVAI